MQRDAATEPIAFGQRLQILRTRRGMPRTTLAGLIGRSPSWVKAVEVGRLATPRLPMLLTIAEALRVRNLAELTGDQSVPVDLFIGPGHRRLADVQGAIDAFIPRQREAPPVEQLRGRLRQAWVSRHRSPDHREVLGALLPDLIGDAQLAVRQAERACTRRRAQAVLSEVYSITQFFVAYQPAGELLWRVAERGMVAAQESDDPHALGVAAWLSTQAHRDGGDHDAADAVNLAALAHLEPLIPAAEARIVAVYGALQFEAGYTAARRGENGTAWGWWDRAEATLKHLPAGYYHAVTSFSRPVIAAHAVTIAVELGCGGEAVRQAKAAEAGTIPSRPRRSRHGIEQARAYQLDNQPDLALAALEQAYQAAPETIAYNGFARRILLELLESSSPRRRRRAGELADKIGILTS